MTPETFSEICLPGNPESASRARDEVRKWLGEDHPAYENARLAVSELVTNAVRHARHGVAGPGADPLVLRLVTYGDLLRIEVADAGLTAENPRVRPDPAFFLAEGGRGLAIVSALSGGSWGHRSRERGPGRIVWCELPANPPRYDESGDGTA
ncbi:MULTISPECIES: ATP-binding protein [unclassified Streptosporangium]|uniref:ATP-binding protein n=1 Tax=unclassified Streptosporangium TaxID=2632669 RepID=UPI002E28619F|nr:MULTISPECIES: ATP-binding protein [unclassified Streptosporangium]